MFQVISDNHEQEESIDFVETAEIPRTAEWWSKVKLETDNESILCDLERPHRGAEVNVLELDLQTTEIQDKNVPCELNAANISKQYIV